MKAVSISLQLIAAILLAPHILPSVWLDKIIIFRKKLLNPVEASIKFAKIGILAFIVVTILTAIILIILMMDKWWGFTVAQSLYENLPKQLTWVLSPIVNNTHWLIRISLTVTILFLIGLAVALVPAYNRDRKWYIIPLIVFLALFVAYLAFVSLIVLSPVLAAIGAFYILIICGGKFLEFTIKNDLKRVFGVFGIILLIISLVIT
jgi:hypothetical protein